MTRDSIKNVKERHSDSLRQLPGVCGVGTGKGKSGEPVITLHLDTDDPQVVAKLPKEIEGYVVETVHSGPFHKQAS